MGETLQEGYFKKFLGPIGFWHKGREKSGDFTRRQRAARPQRRDMTGGLPANSETLYGMYYGTIPELQFASPMAYTPVKVPSMLVGIPTPRAQDDKTQKAVADILDTQGEECPLINETALLIGTSWRWVRFSAKLGRVIWEVIPDDTVSDIEIDLDTNEIVAVWTHEKIAYTDGYNIIKHAERKRRIGRDTIEVTWISAENKAVFKSLKMRNPFGFIPVPFGHDCKETEWRGHSIYGRNLRLFKTNHEIQLARDGILAKFKPKMDQSVEEGRAEEWLRNNGYDNFDDVDPFDADFIINSGEHEKTEFLYLPADATRQHTEAINDNYKRVIIGSGVPEIFWPTLATGNHASTEVQKDLGVEYVHSLRREFNRPYTILFNQSLTIKGFMEQTHYSEVVNDWQQFELVSQKTRAEIFNTMMQGLGVLIQNASLGYDDMLYFIKSFYPDSPVKTRNQLKKAMQEMMKDHTLQLKGDIFSKIDEDMADEGEEEPGAEGDSGDGDDDDLDPGEKEDIDNEGRASK